MDGVHDLGGMHGFGPVEREVNEPAFHERWDRNGPTRERLALPFNLAFDSSGCQHRTVVEREGRQRRMIAGSKIERDDGYNISKEKPWSDAVALLRGDKHPLPAHTLRDVRSDGTGLGGGAGANEQSAARRAFQVHSVTQSNIKRGGRW